MLNELKKQLTYPSTPMFKKYGIIIARHTTPGEAVVITTGLVGEAYYLANEGDMVLTGPNGEDSVMSQIKFDRLYEATDVSGKYKAKAVVKAVQIRAGTPPFYFRTPWGEQHLAKEGDYIATSKTYNFDPEKCFRIRKSVFETTYRKC